MLTEEQYYSYLYRNFIVKNRELFKDCDEKKLTVEPLPKELFNDIMALLDCVFEKYGFDMQKICQPNYNKFILWQRNNYGGRNDRELIIAVKFIIFCCLADKILDSPRFATEEKERVCEKLDVCNFISSKPFMSNAFTEMDFLLNDIREFLASEDVKSLPCWEMIIDKMQRAFESEIYMYKNPLLASEEMMDEQMKFLTDKSVEFEMAAFLLASAISVHPSQINSAKYIANIFWLIDDLCDFVEDIQCKRKNSVLFYCTLGEGKISLQDRVEKSFQKIDILITLLEDNIAALQKCVNKELYEYILNEVWEWCSGVRKAAEKNTEKSDCME